MFRWPIIKIASEERPEGESIHRFEAEGHYKLAASFISGQNNVILDIGCGEGWGEHYLRSKVKCLIGVDYSLEALQKARTRVESPWFHYVKTDACSLGFKQERFDVVCALEILEHLHKREAFLAEVRRVLKKNGYFILSTPNRTYQEKTVAINPYHVKEYNAIELKALLQRYFRIEKFCGIASRFRSIEQSALFKMYVRLKRLLHLEKYVLRGDIKIALLGGGFSDGPYFVEENIDECALFFVICRRED